MIRAWWQGVREYRESITTHHDGRRAVAYDVGREMAHRCTRRRWES
jgi:hypothetical protein